MIDTGKQAEDLLTEYIRNPDKNIIFRRLASFAEKVSGFPLVFASIGAFSTDEGVLFLAPVVTGELLRHCF